MIQQPEERRLLLIDDDEDDFLILKDVTDIHFPSLRITYFAHCDHLHKSLFDDIDIVLLDINMPRVNGFECLDLIRSEYGLTRLPVIMYSNSSAAWDVETAYKRGANFFVKKPGSFQKIRLVLESILSIDWTNLDEITRENTASRNILKY